MYRPLRATDFVTMFERIQSGSDLFMPCCEDMPLQNGDVILGMLAYGSPKAYKFISHNGKVYCIREWDEGNTEFLGE